MTLTLEQLDEIAPCPFCGGEALMLTEPTTHQYGGWFQLGCRNKDCFGPTTSKYGDRNDCIAAWNRRAPSREAVLEEAAKVASDYRFTEIAALHENHAVMNNVSDNIARAIRSLIPQSGG